MAKKETKGKSKKVTEKDMEKGSGRGSAIFGTCEATNFDNFYMPFKNPVGRPLKYQPEELADLFAEYVDWCREHPLGEVRTSHSNGDMGMGNTSFKQEHPRLVSVDAFLVYIGATKRWWGELGAEFSVLKEGIMGYCESYQKEMASAGFFKQNIISRLLGLSDKREVKATGASFKIEVDDTDTADVLKKIMNGETDNEDN